MNPIEKKTPQDFAKSRKSSKRRSWGRLIRIAARISCSLIWGLIVVRSTFELLDQTNRDKPIEALFMGLLICGTIVAVMIWTSPTMRRTIMWLALLATFGAAVYLIVSYQTADAAGMEEAGRLVGAFGITAILAYLSEYTTRQRTGRE
jgi:Ca2+/Na+ antiporter